MEVGSCVCVLIMSFTMTLRAKEDRKLCLYKPNVSITFLTNSGVMFNFFSLCTVRQTYSVLRCASPLTVTRFHECQMMISDTPEISCIT